VSQYSAVAQAKGANLFSRYLCRARLVERLFNMIKQCRRIGTCYDKLAANYLAFVTWQPSAFGCVFMSPRPI
jgi:transposase